MKVAIITTQFLKEFVVCSLEKLNVNCLVEIYAYTDFFHVGELYMELEDKFDGFMVSGPVPKQAIIKKVGTLKKPLVDFGTDLQSYYEMFFKLMYKYNTLDFSRAYLDVTDWIDNSKDIAYYLASGTLNSFMDDVQKVASTKTLSEICEMEEKIANKHIELWNSKKIDFSTTRFSSIVPKLEAAGVNYHFIYPNISLLQSRFDELIKDIHLQKIKIDIPSVIYITIKQSNYSSKDIEKICNLLKKFRKDNLLDLILESDTDSIKIFTKYATVKEITKNFSVCKIKTLVEDTLKLRICVGYGLGTHVNMALANAISAQRESFSNLDNYSFVVTENNESIGPLLDSKVLRVSTDVTPYIKHLSKKVKLSTLTIQKILSVIKSNDNNEITPSELASSLNVSVRTANRFLSNLLKYDEAKISYERQNSTKGRPERVYRIFICEENAST